MKAASGLRPRRLAEVVPQRMSEEPVVILTGPRTVGKSTLLAALAAEFDRPVHRSGTRAGNFGAGRRVRRYGYGLGVPDVAVVVADGAVGGEEA